MSLSNLMPVAWKWVHKDAFISLFDHMCVGYLQARLPRPCWSCDYHLVSMVSLWMELSLNLWAFGAQVEDTDTLNLLSYIFHILKENTSEGHGMLNTLNTMFVAEIVSYRDIFLLNCFHVPRLHTHTHTHTSCLYMVFRYFL